MLKQIVKNLKNMDVSPYDIEMAYHMGNSELQHGELLSNEEYKKLTSYSSKELKKTIFEVYYNSETPELPGWVKMLINEAKQGTNFQGWILVLDWMDSVFESPWDREVLDWDMHEYTFEKGNANEVYGYMLSLEI